MAIFFCLEPPENFHLGYSHNKMALFKHKVQGMAQTSIALSEIKTQEITKSYLTLQRQAALG
jgi:hypothetical protein